MNAVLHVISDRIRHRLPLLEALVESAKGGADVIQVREKKAPASETYALVRQLQRSLSKHGLASDIFVNDRVDIAMAASLSGVHLAAKSLPIPVATQLRNQVEWSGYIGCSVHTLDEAMAAEQAGADYVTFGHIFASDSHPGLPPQGLHALRRVVEALTIPVVAIGGIDHTNVDTVLSTACSGIAVIGAVLNADSPLAVTRTLKREIEKSMTLPKVPFWGRNRTRHSGRDSCNN